MENPSFNVQGPFAEFLGTWWVPVVASLWGGPVGGLVYSILI